MSESRTTAGTPAKLRYLVLTEIIAPYRIPLFNSLALQPGIELLVVFLAETDPGMRQWRVYKDEIRFPYVVLPGIRVQGPGYPLVLNWGLWRCLSRWRPGVIVCGGYNYPASWLARAWASFHRVPFVLSCESTADDLRPGWRLVEQLKRLYLKSCSGYIVPGLSQAAYLRSLGMPGDRIKVTPNSVDNEWYAAMADAARSSPEETRRRHGLPARYFLYSGRLIPEKGVFDLLEAYGTLAPEVRAAVSLVLAGDGIARPALEAAASRISPGTVRFPGFLHREELAEHYAMAESLIMPTWSDPWGLVVNEAMACGLPVVVSRVAGCCRDLVRHEWNGLVVEPRAVPELAEALRRLASDAGLMRRMGARSAEHIRLYSPQVAAAAWAAAAPAQ